MKTAMKKVLSLALALVLLLSVFPMSAFAAEVDADGQSRAPQWPNHGENWWENQGGNNWWENQGGNNWWENQGNWPSFPGQPDDEDNKDEEQEPAAPTSLTVNFYLDTKLVETYTVETETTVKSLIENYCKVDKTTTVNYDGAKVNGDLVELTTAIKLGQEVNIYLITPAQPEPCAVCGKEAHEGDCCANCKELGHVADKCPDALCKCGVNKSDCICCDSCNGTIYEHDARCPENERENHWGEVKVTPKFRNDKGMFYNGEAVYVKMGATMGDVFAKIAIPAAYNFSYWSWDVQGEDAIKERETVPFSGNVVIYAQYAKQVQAVKGAEIYLNLNYDWKMGETVKNVAIGSKMGDVLKNIKDPVRWGYKFAGWYWDANCKNDVEWNDKVLKDCTIFAKWEKAQYETMLKIYVNGNTKSAAKIVDLHDYAKDGWISIDEVKEVVKKYYTSKDSDGLSYYGLFDPANWNSYLRNHKHAGSKHIEVNKFDDTTVYVMVYNAKDRSSATADSTNPKTGDMIMMPAAVLGLSASALAVLFYLNKKRTV